MKAVKARKATFKVKKVNGKRVFYAVNKRAMRVCRKAGKRTKVTVAELKALKDSGSYKYYAYNDEGLLKPIRL